MKGLRTSSWRGNLTRIALLFALLFAGFNALRVYAEQWSPSRTRYPVQGIAVDSGMGAIDWRTIRARHAAFAYVRASSGGRSRDAAFAANWAGARAAGLRYGATHDYSLCAKASDQATLFMTTVPRDAAALPPVVRLRFDPACAGRPARDALLSELNTFLVLIETHSGKTALVRVSRDFDAAYDLGPGINRTLWLDGNFFAPHYANRPWVLWTASDMRRLDGVDAAVEWVVAAP